MGDRMHPMSFGELVTRICKGYRKTGQLLGVDPVSLSGRKAIPIFGGKIETPFGPAAGPNTQLAGNLVAAYAAGARFFELKTVQKMDGEDLAKCVARPCILAYDEGYNVEWSTELTVVDAAAEYIRGWWAIKLLAKELDLGDPDAFIFNMSVGYDLEGSNCRKSITLSTRWSMRPGPMPGRNALTGRWPIWISSEKSMKPMYAGSPRRCPIT